MTTRTLTRLSVCVVVLGVLAACQLRDTPDGEPPLGSPAPGPDWSKVVGAGYPHVSDCAVNITNDLTLSDPGLPAPPDAVTGKDNLACIWDIFAWNSFAALNWPGNTALGKRGLPSSSVTFLNNTDNTAEVVWEAFKEKRELFQDDPSPNWNDIQDGVEVKRFQKPDNLWDMNGGYCTATDQSRAGTASSGPFASNKFHNQLDETAEVQSQALEPLSELCQGHGGVGPMCNISNESVVGPRVWMGTAVSGRPIYYEVKVNYDFFDYLMHPSSDMILPSTTPNLVNDEVAATNALLGNIRLPWRSTAPAPAQGVSNQKAVFNYGSCTPDQGTPESGITGASVPCRTGAVHMKAAWIQMTEDEIAQSPPRYHTTTALYYETPAGAGNEDKLCIAVDTFGLVGLHAIQRVMLDSPPASPGNANQAAPNRNNNPGGAFIFATWEHRSILDASYSHPASFQYVNLKTNPLFGSTAAGEPYPTLANALPVTRMIPTNGDPGAETTCGLSAQQTCQVNTAALAKLTAAGSVWANYRLVGTQFAPNDCAFTEGTAASEAQQLAQCRFDTLLAQGQPHFLANAVIETNQGLQHFLGLPPAQPRLQPQQWCAPASANSSYCDNQAARFIGPSSTTFDRGAHNMTYGRELKNMGGCQGCHGVAQQNGYSFSFVLLDGVNGAQADSEAAADIPATAISRTVPVRLESMTNPGQFLTITTPNTQFNNYYNLGLGPKSAATQWHLQPYSTSPSFGNFGGNIILSDTGGKGVLQLGEIPGFSPSGTTNSALVGPLSLSGTSRPYPAQTVFIVGYTGPGRVADHSFSLVSTAASRITLQADTSTTVSAQSPAVIPAGTSPSTALQQQVFNIVVVDD